MSARLGPPGRHSWMLDKKKIDKIYGHRGKTAKLLVIQVKLINNSIKQIQTMYINLTKDEIRILQTIAKNSGMDDWFCLEDDGTFRDLYKETKSIRKGVKQLIEGMIPHDFNQFDDKDKFCLVNLVAKMI